MMRATRGTSILGLCVVLALGVVGGGSFAMNGESHAQDFFVKWERIEGVTVPGNAIGILNVVGGVPSVGFSWSTTMGKVHVNRLNDRLQFWVKGLVLASQNPGGGLVIGTPSPAVTAIKGTLVCNAAAPPPFSNVGLVDTEPVSLSPQGDARFEGTVNLPVVCDDMAFLIRVANPGVIFDQWIAYGAVRTP